jgi:hypothetical protein
MMTAFNRFVSGVMIVSILGAGMPLPASAGIVATDQVAAGSERDRVTSFLERAEVQAQMQALGVNPQAAAARVNALSDDEIAGLADRIDQLPAGGSDVLTVLVAVFLILLITDLLGLTHIFPFTKDMK